MARLFHGGGNTKQFGSTCESAYPFYNHVGSLESWGWCTFKEVWHLESFQFLRFCNWKRWKNDFGNFGRGLLKNMYDHKSLGRLEPTAFAARWAPTSCKWGYGAPINGLIILLVGVITFPVQSCGNLLNQKPWIVPRSFLFLTFSFPPFPRKSLGLVNFTCFSRYFAWNN